MLNSPGTLRWPWLLLAGVLAASPLLWLDAVGWRLAANSLMLVLGVVVLAVPLGTFLAVLLFRFAVPLRRLWITLLVLQIFVPLYVFGAAWRSTLGFTGWAHDTPLGRLSWLMLEGWSGAIWVHVAAAVPWVVLIVGLALRYVEPELEEDALTSGSAWQVLRHVTLRRAGLAALVAALWIAVITATEITATDLFQVRTFAEELYSSLAATATTPVNETQAVIANTAIAAWLAVVLMVVVSKLAVFAKQPSMRRAVLLPLTAGKRAVATCSAALAIIVFVGIPIGTLVRNAGISFVPGADGRPQQTWNAADAARMIVTSPMTYHEEYGWSLEIAVAAATCVVVVAAGVCWFGRSGGLRAAPALGISAICLAIPGPLLAIGIIKLLNQQESDLFPLLGQSDAVVVARSMVHKALVFLYDRTIVPPLTAQVIKALPVAILILWLIFRGVPEETLESASTAGAGRWTRFWRIAMPQRLAALSAAWFAAFALAIGEVPASILLNPPGIETISPMIFRLLHGENVYEIAGIILAMFCLIALVTGFIALWWRKYWQRD